MKLVVGLGNIGPKYDRTRHNIGFLVVDELHARWGVTGSKVQFDGDLGEGQFGTEKVLLLKPRTLMNRSGSSVRPLAAFRKIEPADILIVCDDMNLPLGTLRTRGAGSAGGQNGLAHVLEQLGTQAVPRLRVGIGRPPGSWDPVDYVLGKFAASEWPLACIAAKEAADAVECWVRDGLAACMNRFNRTPEDPKKKTDKPPRPAAGPRQGKPPQADPSAGSTDEPHGKPGSTDEPRGKPHDELRNPPGGADARTQAAE